MTRRAADVPAQALRDFNHEARLALHTLQANLQHIRREAQPAQLQALTSAEHCCATLLQLLQDFTGAPSRHKPEAADQGASSAPQAGTLVLPALPGDHKTRFLQWVNDGLLLQVEHWATGVGEDFPHLEAFANAVGYYASRGDLRSLQTIALRWTQG